MSLTPPVKVGKLQTALHAKAKAAPSYRFYLVYDKVYRWDVLVYAYERCKANKGAAGDFDGVQTSSTGLNGNPWQTVNSAIPNPTAET